MSKGFEFCNRKQTRDMKEPSKLILFNRPIMERSYENGRKRDTLNPCRKEIAGEADDYKTQRNNDSPGRNSKNKSSPHRLEKVKADVQEK